MWHFITKNVFNFGSLFCCKTEEDIICFLGADFPSETPKGCSGQLRFIYRPLDSFTRSLAKQFLLWWCQWVLRVLLLLLLLKQIGRAIPRSKWKQQHKAGDDVCMRPIWGTYMNSYNRFPPPCSSFRYAASQCPCRLRSHNHTATIQLAVCVYVSSLSSSSLSCRTYLYIFYNVSQSVHGNEWTVVCMYVEARCGYRHAAVAVPMWHVHNYITVCGNSRIKINYRHSAVMLSACQLNVGSIFDWLTSACPILVRGEIEVSHSSSIDPNIYSPNVLCTPRCRRHTADVY